MKTTDDERAAEHAAMLEDISVAEEQIARGEAIDHDVVREMVLARFRLREPPS